MKTAMILIAVLSLAFCEVCMECTTTYYDPAGSPVIDTTDEVCGTKHEVKEHEGTHDVNGVKTVVKCR